MMKRQGGGGYVHLAPGGEQYCDDVTSLLNPGRECILAPIMPLDGWLPAKIGDSTTAKIALGLDCGSGISSLSFGGAVRILQPEGCKIIFTRISGG